MGVTLFFNMALALIVSPIYGQPSSFRQQQQPVFVSAHPGPPALFEGITLTTDQARRRAELNREFGTVFKAQIERTKQLRERKFDSVSSHTIEMAHQQLLKDVRSLLTPEQQIVFDRNQSARNAYIEQRKAESAARRQSSPR